MAAESVEIAKQIEAKFLDFESLNIFREDEAVYNFTILRKRDELDCEHNAEVYDEVVLEELFTKSKRTVEVLSEILLLSKNQVFLDGDIIE